MSKNEETFSSILAAIEMGSNSISIAVADVSSMPEISVLYYDSLPSTGLLSGHIVDGGSLFKDLTVLINKAEHILGASLNNVYLALPPRDIQGSNSTHSVQIAEGVVSDHHIESLIGALVETEMTSTEEIIHVIPGHFETAAAYKTNSPAGHKSDFLTARMHSIKIPEIQISAVSDFMDRLGVQQASYVSPGLSAAGVSVTPAEKDVGGVFIYARAGQIMLMIWSEGELVYSSTLNFGLNPLSRRVLGLNHRDLKNITARLRSRRPLKAPTVSDVMAEDISSSVEELARVVDANLQLNSDDDANSLGSLVHCAILSGDLALFPNADAIFEKILGVPARVSKVGDGLVSSGINYRGLDKLPPHATCIAGMFTLAIEEYIREHAAAHFTDLWKSYIG